MELLHCGESRWRNRATPQKWRFVRGHDNLIHGRCAIYFPGGRRGYRSPSLSLSRLIIPSHKAGYFVGGNVAGYFLGETWHWVAGCTAIDHRLASENVCIYIYL